MNIREERTKLSRLSRFHYWANIQISRDPEWSADHEKWIAEAPNNDIRKANRIIKRLYIDIAFLGMSILCWGWVLVSAAYNGEDGYFARSGAVLVAISLIAEFGLLAENLDSKKFSDHGFTDPFEWHAKMVKWLSIFQIFAGTLIWAYGDLFHRWVTGLTG